MMQVLKSGFQFCWNVFLAALICALLGLPIAYFSVSLNSLYGYSLFLLSPLLLGFFSVLFYGRKHACNLKTALLISGLSTLLLCVLLLVVAIEGVFCILMASPLVFLLVFIGAFLGYQILQSRLKKQNKTRLMISLPILLPLLMLAESNMNIEPPVIAVTTTTEIQASPVRVWDALVHLKEIPTDQDKLFSLGINHPLKVSIIKNETTRKMTRYVHFAMGEVVEEPIEAWEDAKLLGFSVKTHLPVMKELSPYAWLNPPHVDQHFAAQAGEFRLVGLDTNRTRLESTTWYRHNVWPIQYWTLWSNFMLHRVHTVCNEEIKRIAELN